MSTVAEPPARRKSAASRYFFLFLVGLVVGAIATVMLLRALDARKDHFPDSLMVVQGWHVDRFKAAVQGNRCAASDLVPHLQALRALANDLEPGFPGLADDPRFKDHASKYRATLNAALATPPQDCTAAGTALEHIGESCKACHQDFRG